MSYFKDSGQCICSVLDFLHAHKIFVLLFVHNVKPQVRIITYFFLLFFISQYIHHFSGKKIVWFADLNQNHCLIHHLTVHLKIFIPKHGLLKYFPVAGIPLCGDNFSGFKTKEWWVLQGWTSWLWNVHPPRRSWHRKSYTPVFFSSKLLFMLCPRSSTTTTHLHISTDFSVLICRCVMGYTLIKLIN